jgi:hypothetical protein
VRVNVWIVVLALTAVSCGSSGDKCGPGTCNGCCDPSGVCNAGNSGVACGSAGQTCLACGALDSCELGVCTQRSGGQGTDGGNMGTGADGGSTGNCNCPKGEYCDLNSQSCVPGCNSDTDCFTGQICNASHACVTGCRQDSQCAAGDICNASNQCVLGCRQDSECGAGEICNTSNQCVAGCRMDSQCSAGDICDGTTFTCRPGCRSAAQCATGDFCAASTLTCVAFAGSGRCRGVDTDCPSGQVCNPQTLTCAAPTGGASCTGNICSGSPSLEVCDNGVMITTQLGTESLGACGMDTSWSPATLTCEQLGCETTFTCATGLYCSLGESCACSTCAQGSDYDLCFSPIFVACTTDVDCAGIKCNTTTSRCDTHNPCTTGADCTSDLYVCVSGACTEYWTAPCAQDSDCASSDLHCETEIGLCGRN